MQRACREFFQRIHFVEGFTLEFSLILKIDPKRLTRYSPTTIRKKIHKLYYPSHIELI